MMFQTFDASLTIRSCAIPEDTMRKSAVFLSFALTAFVITMLVGVINTYNGLNFTEPFTSTQDQTINQVVPTQEVPPIPLAAPSQQVAGISPQDAASIAAKSLNRTDLYSVQLTSINGLNLYKITFVSGEVVYISMDGQVVLTVPALPQPTPTVITLTTAGGPSPHNGGKKNGGGGGGGDGGGD